MVLQARILDSVVFKRDMEVGRQDGHQLPTEFDLMRILKKWQANKEKGTRRMITQQSKDKMNPDLMSVSYLTGTELPEKTMLPLVIEMANIHHDHFWPPKEQ